jgi:hypothetical protein
MLFNVQLAMVVDAIDQDQAEMLALGALQAAKAQIHDQTARVVDDAWKVTVATRSRPHRRAALCRSKMPEGHVPPRFGGAETAVAAPSAHDG